MFSRVVRRKLNFIFNENILSKMTYFSILLLCDYDLTYIQVLSKFVKSNVIVKADYI